MLGPGIEWTRRTSESTSKGPKTRDVYRPPRAGASFPVVTTGFGGFPPVSWREGLSRNRQGKNMPQQKPCQKPDVLETMKGFTRVDFGHLDELVSAAGAGFVEI